MARARNKKPTVEVEMTDDEVAMVAAALDGDPAEVEFDLEASNADFDAALAAAEAPAEPMDMTEVYESQPDGDTVEVDTEKAVASAKKSVGKVVRSATRTPKMDFEDAMRAKLVGGMLTLDQEPLDAAAVDAIAGKITQKKVKEKVLNILDAVAGRSKLSVYTEIAIAAVKDAMAKGGTLQTKDIAERMKGTYSPGTTAAQSGQMRAMLPALGIVTLEGNVMRPNPDSVLLDVLIGGGETAAEEVSEAA